MLTEIILPKQGLQMTEGTLIKWLAAVGDSVAAGQPLFEMETDKLTITIDSPADGKLLKIIHGEGDTVPVAQVIGLIGQTGDDAAWQGADPAQAPSSAAPAAPPASTPTQPKEPARVFITPRAKTVASERGIDPKQLTGSGPDGLVTERDVLAAPVVRATPVARALAQLEGVDLSAVTGSGQGGKIMKRDVLAAWIDPADAPEQADTVVPITGMRRAISENMLMSLRTMAQACHRIRVDMSQPALLRAACKAAEKPVSYQDIIILAVTRALLEFPRMNAWVTQDKILEKHAVHMGIAVAVERGLIVPTVFDAHRMTLQQLHASAAAKIEAARTGQLTAQDLSGATFTVTNLGMYDIEEFTAIINPPQVGILAIGKIEDTPVVRDGQVTVRPMMALCLTYDHRAVDGAPAAKFLQRVKALLENPFLLMT